MTAAIHDACAAPAKDNASNGCPMMAQHAKADGCPMGSKATTRPTTAPSVYTCPMHPEVVASKPGKCPKCGMDLVPKQEKPKGDQKPTDKDDTSSGHTHNH
ncbi:MAG: heavy metal-binding domain-containing protein [Bacillota bacterium]